MVGTKRRRDEDEADEGTPRKLRAQFAEDPTEAQDTYDAQTPSRRGKVRNLVEIGTPKSILKKSALFNEPNGATPRSTRKLVFDTPTKTPRDASPDGTPTIVRNADRSARRKSNRQILERTLNGVESDEDALDEEDELAEQILGGDSNKDAEQEEGQPDAALAPPDTPSKRGRGRPKGSGKVGRPRKPRSPSPPTELPPHEEYFYQNRPGGAKTSNNTLSAQTLLNHDEYFQAMKLHQDRHAPEMEFLWGLHSRAYGQWIFELEEGFNICLYGYGSKRDLSMSFAEHLHAQAEKLPKILIINGYTPGLTIRDVLATVANQMLPKTLKLPAQPSATLDLIFGGLSERPHVHLTLIIHSIDHPNLRKAQSSLARLASNPSISLLATCDTPNFALLWDISLTRQFRFLYHDATTFEPYTAELDVVEDVNTLLGRSGRRLGGKDGVGYVLKSLPENARNLFRILVAEQLAQADTEGEAAAATSKTPGDYSDIDSDDVLGASDEETAMQQQGTPSRRVRGKGRPAKKPKAAAARAVPKPVVSSVGEGVEYRTLYHKAVEEFVCSSELNFRTLLKEFHDHQMVESRKDGMGTERLSVPFGREELEGMLEELV
jgi:origin recognition complex subunit 2